MQPILCGAYPLKVTQVIVFDVTVNVIDKRVVLRWPIWTVLLHEHPMNKPRLLTSVNLKLYRRVA